MAFCYSQKNIEVTEYEFRRYIKPQLRSITQDYKTLIMSLNPELKYLKKSFVYLRDLQLLQLNVVKKCKTKNNIRCNTHMAKVETIIKNLLRDSQKKVNLTSNKHLNIDEKIKSKTQLELYRQELFNAQVLLRNLSFQRKISNVSETEYKEFAFLLDKIAVNFHIFIIKSSDNRFQDELNAFWTNFVKPVTKYILIQDNKKYFENKITTLNITWNTLNVMLTKRNRKISKQTNTLLAIMHRRWNNILKVSLKN